MDENTLSPQEPIINESKYLDLVSAEELVKALVGTFQDQKNSDPLQYLGYLADPQQMLMYRLGTDFHKWTPSEEMLYNIADTTSITTC